MSIRCRDCIKCGGVTEETDDRKYCLLCGWVKYKDPITSRNRARLAVAKNNSLGSVAVPYYGGFKRFRGIYAKVKIKSSSRKNGSDAFAYEMDCPYDECGEAVIPDSLKSCKDAPLRYVCTDRHVWYLIIENNQPSFWR
tara:strand:+ start:602 stop:1018 length:417 start_codon:yes stop_codon:yes gene_type:complete